MSTYEYIREVQECVFEIFFSLFFFLVVFVCVFGAFCSYLDGMHEHL